MNDADKISVAIVLGAVIVSGTLAWLGYPVRSRPPEANPAAAPQPPTPTAPLLRAEPTPQPVPTPTAADQGPSLPMTEFLGAWHGNYDREADEKCFKKADAKGPDFFDPAPHFLLTLNADGSVKNVEPTSPPGPRQALYDCVASIVRSMKLAPSGAERSGEIQAGNPAMGRKNPPSSSVPERR